MIKKSVGLVILTNYPDEGIVAILSRRSKTDSYPLACQVTCHGGLERGESFFQALKREAVEELGPQATNEILPTNIRNLTLLTKKSDEKEETATYGIFVYDPTIYDRLVSEDEDDSFVKFIRFPQSKVDEIKNLRDFDKKVGVTDLNTIAMFPDEIEAVKAAFEKLSPPTL